MTESVRHPGRNRGGLRLRYRHLQRAPTAEPEEFHDFQPGAERYAFGLCQCRIRLLSIRRTHTGVVSTAEH
jgi:hypothetical protein